MFRNGKEKKIEKIIYEYVPQKKNEQTNKLFPRFATL